MTYRAVAKDPVDVRDLIRHLTLGPPSQPFLCAAAGPASAVSGLSLAILDPGERTTCIGEALAALLYSS